jgi:hypothetical protein
MSEEKNELNVPSKFDYPRVKTTCQSCIFYNKQCAWGSKPCKQLGILGSSKPCKKFVLDPYTIDMLDESSKNLQDIVSSLSTKDLGKFAILLSQEHKTRSKGFAFGQEVVVHMFKGNYLSNFAKARVISANKDYVFIQGIGGFRGMLFHSSVLTLEQWAKKRQFLIAKKKIKDPNYASYTSLPQTKEGLKRAIPNVGKHKMKMQKHKARSVSM